MEEINSLGHDVFKVAMSHSGQDDEQAVEYISQGSKGSSKFQEGMDTSSKLGYSQQKESCKVPTSSGS